MVRIQMITIDLNGKSLQKRSLKLVNSYQNNQTVIPIILPSFNGHISISNQQLSSALALIFPSLSLSTSKNLLYIALLQFRMSRITQNHSFMTDADTNNKSSNLKKQYAELKQNLKKKIVNNGKKHAKCCPIWLLG